MFLQGWRTRAALLILILSWMPHTAAWALDQRAEHPELARALAYFERGDYQRSATELETLLEDDELTGDERQQALEALGISHYVLGDMLDSRRSFSALLDLAPGYRPDPLYIPPEIVAFVADIKRNRATNDEERRSPPVEPEPGVPERPHASQEPPAGLMPAYEPPRPELSVVDLLPFGAGQFRRGWSGRGTTLAAMQTVFLGANIGLYYYRHCSLKESCSAAYYLEEDLSRARNLQTLQIVSGSLFIATATLGVLDALQLPLKPAGVTLQPIPSGLGITVPLD